MTWKHIHISLAVVAVTLSLFGCGQANSVTPSSAVLEAPADTSETGDFSAETLQQVVNDVHARYKDLMEGKTPTTFLFSPRFPVTCSVW